MKEIKLTQGKVALVDDEDFDWLSQWKWHYVKGGCNTGYAARVDGIRPTRMKVKMHRLIMNTSFGDEVDHVDHNGCNNQKFNMRNCTHAMNSKNVTKHMDNTSGFKGVSWHSNKWQAQIKMNGKSIHLGHFANIEAASCAYDKAARKYFGEFARLNDAELLAPIGVVE